MHLVTTPPDPSDASLTPTLVPALLKTAKLVRAIMAVHLSELGLQTGQDEVLLAFEKARPMSPSQLATKLGIRADTAAKLLARLVHQRLAIRVENMIEARSMVVVITASGLELQARLRAMLSRIDRDLHATMDIGSAQATYAEISVLSSRLSELLTPHR